MSARTTSLMAPPVPQVNLLPPEVKAARGLSRIKRWLALVVAVALLGAAALVFLGMAAERDASARLADAQEETNRLLAEQQKYAEVPLVLGQLAMAEEARRVGMSTEVLWEPYLSAISATTPEGVSIESLAVTGATPMQLPGLPLDALQSVNVATVTFSAGSLTVPDTADWLDALETVPGFKDAWFSSASITEKEGVPYYSVSATVQVDAAAYAGRFEQTEGDEG